MFIGCGGTSKSVNRSVEQTGRDSGIGRAIDLERTTLAGESIRTRTHRGKVIVVTYFATWCKPCLRLVPRLDRLAYGKVPLRGMVFFQLALTKKHEPS